MGQLPARPHLIPLPAGALSCHKVSNQATMIDTIPLEPSRRVFKGTDVDKPHNPAKAVTVE